MAESFDTEDGRNAMRGPLEVKLPVERDGQTFERVLPYVLGVLGDFSGGSAGSLPPLSERKFILVDRDNFDGLLSILSPSLKLTVEDLLRGDGSLMTVRLSFKKMEDFEPTRIIEQVEPLRKLLEARKGMGHGPPEDASSAGAGTETDTGTPLLDRILDQIPLPGEGSRRTGHPRGGSPEASAADQALSRQLGAILQAEEFRRLEASWLGLRRLVFESPSGPHLKIKVLNVSKKELRRDLEGAEAQDQSWIFKAIYEDQYGASAEYCEPFGVLIGDYEFRNHPEDLEILSGMAEVAAASFCPFIAGAGPDFFGLDDHGNFPASDNLVRVFETAPYTRWRSFREAEESRFVALIFPRVLARLPYGKSTRPVEDFDFEEIPPGRKTWRQLRPQLLWMNAATILGSRIAESFDRFGWPTKICGAEGGGMVQGLPVIKTIDEAGDWQALATEIPIDEKKGREMAQVGFIPFYQWKDTDMAGFFEVPTAHRPRGHQDPRAAATEAIRARLPCALAASRILQHILVRGLDMLLREGRGSPENARRFEDEMNRWIGGYVSPDPADPELEGRYPLTECRIEIRASRDSPGMCRLTVSLKPSPWLIGGELASPLKVGIEIPSA